MKSFKLNFVAMFLIMAAMFVSACSGPAVVKRVNQDNQAAAQTERSVPKTAVKTEQTPVATTVSKGAIANNRPIDYVRMGDPNKPAPSYAGKLAFDGYNWRRQIVLYNGATEDIVTEEMKNYVSRLVPNREPSGKWDSFGYWLMDGEGHPLTEPAEITAATEIVYAPPPPVVKTAPPDAKVQMDRLIKYVKDERPKTETAPKPYPKDWEAKLNRLGYYCYQAVWDFQRDARDDGIKFYGQKVMVDGELGPQTKKAIDIYLFLLENPNCPKDYKVIQRALAAAAKAKK
ncbi:MAG: hypothetical protein WC619_04290 [Patescibacteria group bacterium]